ncbi:DUF2149 domain-containing protein [Pseudomaricurvus alkylphenolicus]|jgi:hypothetical protein|uniref:DUF2149 domain-containing protein n=1 Tax=Pseudomaricurvus alkylphenolicus TaxID=1306991 RepID=UPI0014226D8F|nr:DUF2149 domain-containing protein [Pseudomaricurvus alkylphenolicus]NIB38891.1 DUF2149 domain-containing protein [Pseudomaricurvus alkylphenolicus]
MKRRKNPGLQEHFDNDPMASVASLFDIAMVFSVALMAAIVSYLDIEDLLFSEQFTVVKNPGESNMEIITRKDGQILRYQATENASGTSQGNGKRVGTAYQLESGEIIYLPD